MHANATMGRNHALNTLSSRLGPQTPTPKPQPLNSHRAGGQGGEGDWGGGLEGQGELVLVGSPDDLVLVDVPEEECPLSTVVGSPRHLLEPHVAVLEHPAQYLVCVLFGQHGQVPDRL